METLGEVHCDDGYWVHVSGSIFPELEAVEVSVAALKTERESQERIVFRILMRQIEDLANYSKK